MATQWTTSGNDAIGRANTNVRIDCDNDASETGARIVFSTDNEATELMRIQDNGNVGIGTPTPGAKLVVNDQSMTSDGPLFLVDLNSTNTSGVPPSTWMFGSQFKTNLSSTHDRFYIGQHNQLIDNHVGFGDHIGHASHAYGYVNRNAGGGSTGGDLWAYYGIVSNRDGGGTGHTVHGIGMELNTINCEKNYSEDLDNLDALPSDFMLGIAIWPELQTSYQNTRGLYIWANTNTSPYCGYDTAIHCLNFVNTGIYLNSANAAKTRLSGIRFGDDLDYDLIIHRKNTTNDYWGLANPSTDYIVWRYDVRNAPKDILSLTSSGSVGIGCTAPQSKLEVTGTARLGTPSANNSYVIDLISQYDNIIGFKNGDGDRDWQIGYDNTNSNFLIQSGNNSFGTDADVRIAINKDSGSVGIGTPSPTTQTHIKGAGQATAAFSDSGNLGSALFLHDYTQAAGSGGALLIGGETGNKWFAAIKGLLTDGSTNSIGDLAISLRNTTSDTALTQRVMIKSGGSVGIGVTSPNEKLEVAGRVRANTGFNVNGTNGWTGTFTVKVGGVDKTCTVSGGIITNVA